MIAACWSWRRARDLPRTMANRTLLRARSRWRGISASKHESLDGAEVAHRFPQFLGLAGNEKAYFEPAGGYVFPERCISAQLNRALRLGAQIRTGVEVLSIDQHRHGSHRGLERDDPGTARPAAGRRPCWARHSTVS